MCYAVFPMFGVIYKRGRHITVDALSMKLGGRKRLILSLLIDAAMIAGAMILLVAGISGTRALYASGMRVVGILDLPQFLMMLSIPLGAGLLLLYSIESGIRNLASLAACHESFDSTVFLGGEYQPMEDFEK